MLPKRIVVIGTNYPDLELYCPHWHGIRAGLKKLGIKYIFVSCRPKLDIEQICAFKPDLIIYGLKDMVLRADWRREIRGRLPKAKIVMWYGDFRDDSSSQVDADCSEMDAMFVSNNAQKEYYIRKWKMQKVFFLPLACEPIPKPIINKKFMFDFVFIGGQITSGAFHKRASLIANFKHKADLTIINSFEAPVRAEIFKAMPSIYSSSKICLDVSHFTDRDKYTSIRYWEIPAFWGFALTKRFPGCEEFYPEDSRAYFDSLEEGIAKKKYYLTHESQRVKMMLKAHKISLKHTYDSRFKQMFKLI